MICILPNRHLHTFFYIHLRTLAKIHIYILIYSFMNKHTMSQTMKYKQIHKLSLLYIYTYYDIQTHTMRYTITLTKNTDTKRILTNTFAMISHTNTHNYEKLTITLNNTNAHANAHKQAYTVIHTMKIL